MITRPLLVVLPFSNLPQDQLESLAESVVLPEDLRQKGQSESRWLAYCAGRAALALAAREKGIKDMKIAPDPDFGFLSVRERPDLFVNVSHTEQIAVGALARRPVGVDIENIHRSVSVVLRRAAAQDEAPFHRGNSLKVEGGEVPDAVTLWSAKEAFSKALGLGIKFGLHELKIRLEGEMPFLARSPLRGPLVVGEPAVHVVRVDDYVITICAEKLELSQGIELRVLRQLPLGT